MRHEIPEQTGITPSARIYGPGNVLDKMPKAVQSRAKVAIHVMRQAPSRETALETYGISAPPGTRSV